MNNLEKKILLVEDDEFFRDVLFDVLKKNFQVIKAPDGKSAREILSIQNVDLVLSDIQMPGCSGIELLDWVKKNKPVPFVIMTGFSTLLETKSAYDLGARGFLAKPFQIEELLTIINSILVAKKEKEREGPATQDLCKVGIDEFVTRPTVEFDVYIKLSDTKFIKIAHAGGALARTQLEHYKVKGITHLYILKKEFGKIVHLNLELVKLMKNRDDISEAKKINFLKYTGETLLESAFIDGLDPEKFEDASAFVKLTVGAAMNSTECHDLLGVLTTHSDQIYAHSLAVSMYAVLISKELGIKSEVSLNKIGMAGLMHDIGKKEVDPILLGKARHLLTIEERKEIESHVIRGQAILSSLKDIHADVIQMVSEHHEDVEGQGFPLKTVKRDQHPLSKILQCANIFIEAVNTNRLNKSPVKAPAVLAQLGKLYGSRIAPECLAALKKIFAKT